MHSPLGWRTCQVKNEKYIEVWKKFHVENDEKKEEFFFFFF